MIQRPSDHNHHDLLGRAEIQSPSSGYKAGPIRFFDRADNFIQLDNAVTRVLNPYLSGNAMKVLLAIIDKTVGWQKPADTLSYSQLKKATGIASDETLSSTLRELMGVDKEFKPVGVPLMVRVPVKGKGCIRHSYSYALNKGVEISIDKFQWRNGTAPPRPGTKRKDKQDEAAKDRMDVTSEPLDAPEIEVNSRPSKPDGNPRNRSDISSEIEAINGAIASEIEDTKDTGKIEYVSPSGLHTLDNKALKSESTDVTSFACREPATSWPPREKPLPPVSEEVKAEIANLLYGLFYSMLPYPSSLVKQMVSKCGVRTLAQVETFLGHAWLLFPDGFCDGQILQALESPEDWDKMRREYRKYIQEQRDAENGQPQELESMSEGSLAAGTEAVTA